MNLWPPRYGDRYGPRYPPAPRDYYERGPSRRPEYPDPRPYERYERPPGGSYRRSRSPRPPRRDY